MGQADGTQLVGVNHATGLVAAQSRMGLSGFESRLRTERSKT